MYEKILVPLDGSELAEVALPYAEELGWRILSQITLLRVSESVESQRLHEHEIYLQRESSQVKQNIAQHLEKEDQARNIEVNYVITEGYPAEEIVEYAEKSHIDTIIMATHGRTGIMRWALGSVADKVIRAANQPVILIRAGESPYGIKGMRQKDMLNEILVPLDGSKESETIIPYIEELALKVNAGVTLLQVIEKTHRAYAGRGMAVPLTYDRNEIQAMKKVAREYLEELSNQLVAAGISTKSEVRGGPDASREIIRAADELHADLVALTTHRRTGAGKGAFWNVADMVLRSGNNPIMLVRGPWPGNKE